MQGAFAHSKLISRVRYQDQIYENRKGRIAMIYTEEVRKELDNILKAFENYIDSQNYFDIVYSKKIGYVWIVVDPPGAVGAEQLDTPEAMLNDLFRAY